MDGARNGLVESTRDLTMVDRFNTSLQTISFYVERKSMGFGKQFAMYFYKKGNLYIPQKTTFAVVENPNFKNTFKINKHGSTN